MTLINPKLPQIWELQGSLKGGVGGLSSILGSLERGSLPIHRRLNIPPLRSSAVNST